MGLGWTYLQNKRRWMDIQNHELVHTTHTHTHTHAGGGMLKWITNINKYLKHNQYHRIAQDRKEWQRLRESFAQIGPSSQ